MNKFKTLVYGLFALILMVGLSACGGGGDDTTTQEIEPVPEESVQDTEDTTGTTQPGETTPPMGETGDTTVGEPEETEQQ